ncbi:hypothetical protein PR048_025790 [Dryococelus australis]|uniref:Uncharacterized protein n=1 Tax=Dryococelus australis TaxID=614101 RepID=A0ABQ9GJH9_9NEOP|nr:hypothetical protein PR048_025790 [Dryococelus australis]
MHCGQVEEIWLFTATTLLDPHFKGKVFSDRTYLDTAEISLQQEAEKIVYQSNRAEGEKLEPLALPDTGTTKLAQAEKTSKKNILKHPQQLCFQNDILALLGS